MTQHPFKRLPFVLSSLSLATVSAFAQTTAQFDGGSDTPYSTSGSGVIQPGDGGSTGNYYELLNGGGSLTNAISFERTQTGAYSNVNATFDFRAGTAANSANADGIGVVFLPTGTHGTGSTVVSGITAEEPNLAGTLAVGFDFYNGINEISAHWDGRTIMEGNLGNGSVLENGSFNRLQIQTEQIGNGANLTVTHTHTGGVALSTPTVLYRGALPSWQPYESRVQFNGRTGGQTMSAHLDNINVNATGSVVSLGAAGAATTLRQDFDTVANGSSMYVGTSNNSAVPHLVTGDGSSNNSTFLRLTTDNVGGTRSRIAFDRAFDGGVGSSQTLSFDFRTGKADNGNAADGMSVVFLPTATQGNAGNGVSVDVEPNVAGALSFAIDTWNNGGIDGNAENSVSLHWNGTTIATAETTGLQLDNNTWRNAQLTVQSAAGGANVSLAIGGTTYINNQFVAGFVPYDYRVEFAGSTGGSSGNFDIDNIVSGRSQIANTPGVIRQDFQGGGSEYKAFDRNVQSGTNPKNHVAILQEGGNNFLRLTHNQNTQNSFVGFDRFVRDNTLGSGTLKASFDFRMTGAPGNAADGFAFGLFNTATYGNTGDAGISPSWESAGDVPGALLFGFDAYNKNRVRVSYNGTSTFVDVPTGSIDLKSGEFHNADITLTAATDPNDALLTMILEAANGTSTTVFSNFLLSGLNLSTFDFRAGFGGRTGGQNMNIDIDNLLITLAPEPGRAILGLAGLLMVAGRRKRLA